MAHYLNGQIIACGQLVHHSLVHVGCVPFAVCGERRCELYLLPMSFSGLGFGVWARLRDERRLLVGVALVALVAVVLLAAAPVFGSSVAIAALRSRVAAASVADGGVTVTGRVDGADLTAVDADVRRRVAGTPALTEPWGLMVSDAFTTPLESIGDRTVVASIGWWSGPSEVLGVVEGRLPGSGAQGAIHVAAAEALGVGLGDEVVLRRRDVELALTVVGLFAPPESPRMEVLERLAAGVASDASFVELGPVLVGPEVFDRGGSRASATWVTTVAVDDLHPDGVARLAAGVAGLERALPDLEVASGLPRLLGLTGSAVTAASATIDSLLVSLAVLSLIALAFTVAALVDERRMHIAMVRARGANVGQVAWASAGEGTLLAAGIVAAGPPIAVLVVSSIRGALGWLGRTLEPQLSTAAWWAAAAGGLLAVAVLTAPAAAAAGGFATAASGRGRRMVGSGVVRRFGLDIAVLAAAGVALWRLLSGWVPTSGADPLVTLAPGLTWLVGMVGLSRMAPPAFAAAERMSERVAPEWRMAVESTARRPDHSNRLVMLVASAVAIVGFATSFGASWRASQHDQATLEVGAARSVQPTERAWQEAGAFDGVGPVLSRVIRVGSTQPSVRLVALDATVVDLRPDLVSSGAAWAGLGSGRRLGVPVAASGVEATADLMMDGAPIAGGVGVQLVAQDRFGRVVRSDRVELEEGSGIGISFELGATGPFDLVGVILSMAAPAQTDPASAASSDVALHLSSIRSGGVAVAWEEEAFDVTTITPGLGSAAVEAAAAAGTFEVSSTVTGVGPVAPITSTLVLQRDDLSPLEAFGTPDFYVAGDLMPGDELLMSVGAVSPPVTFVGTIDAAPTEPEAEQAVVIDYADLQTWAWFAGGDALIPDRLLVPDAAGVVAAAGRAATSIEERIGERATDPVSVGVVVSLGLGAVAVSLVTGVGLVFAALAAVRGRVFELALLEALGLPASGLRRVFVGEHVLTGVVGAVAGTVIGLGLAEVAVPSMTVDAVGAVVVPAPRLVVPWLALTAIAVGSVVAVWAIARAAFHSLRRDSPGSVIRLGEER
jgi:hypothetical protein